MAGQYDPNNPNLDDPIYNVNSGYNQAYMSQADQSAAMQNPNFTPQQKQQIFEQAYAQAPGAVPEDATPPPANEAPKDAQGNIDYTKMTGAELESIVSGNFMQGLNERKGQLQKMVEEYNAEKADPRSWNEKIDWKPMLALYDSWNARAGTPTKLADGASSPESNAERSERLTRMADLIRKEQTGLSGDQQEYLKELLRNRTSKENNAAKLAAMLEMAGMKGKKSDKDKNDQNDRDDDKFVFQLSQGKEATKIKGNVELMKAIDDYQKIVEQYGDTIFSDKNPEAKRAATDAIIAMKEAAELGALSGPDMGLAEGIVPNETNLINYFKSKAQGGTAGIIAALEGSRAAARQRYERGVQNIRAQQPRVADRVVKPWETQVSTLRKPKGSAPTKSIDDMTDAEVEAQLKAMGK